MIPIQFPFHCKTQAPELIPNKLASIFDPFVTTKPKGTGLGLAICKMIIEQHGGKLSAASDTQYGGARFEITLPTKIAEPSVPVAPGDKVVGSR